ncbi:MAG TPA: GntR family transcriptional regulator [Acidobacteriaceae bacterium]|nr:GntR family transcriptional regulator [Acidobacteriaceae bacterium]
MAVASKLTKRTRTGRAAASGAESLARKAYEQIRDEILQGKLAVGDILSRRRLAADLNMSFLPITEALQRLEAEGLVESRPRIGTRVRIPTKQDIIDSFVIREALEAQAARLCCDKMTSTERDQVARNAKRLDDLYKASASESEDSRFLFSVQTYHMQFHMLIAELARCPGLLRAIEKEQVLVFNWLYDTATHRNSLPVNFHSDLAKALCSGDRMKADEAMRKHISYGLNSVVESLGTLELSKRWRLTRGR